MTHMLTLHCSAQAAADSGPASSRGPLARDWLGAMPAGLDPVSCSGRSPASPLGDELYTYAALLGAAAVDSACIY